MSNDIWICSECGSSNHKADHNCWNCNEYFFGSNPEDYINFSEIAEDKREEMWMSYFI